MASQLRVTRCRLPTLVTHLLGVNDTVGERLVDGVQVIDGALNDGRVDERSDSLEGCDAG
jgi:hypothetical protein